MGSALIAINLFPTFFFILSVTNLLTKIVAKKLTHKRQMQVMFYRITARTATDLEHEIIFVFFQVHVTWIC